MSYEKVKSIKIDEKEGKVFINCASNNVRPLTYSREEYPYFSKILKEEGKQAVEIALLKSYEEGNLQEGKNKFTEALKVLFYVFGEEYKRFNWRERVWGDKEQEKKQRELRESQEFKDLLLKALNYKIPEERYVIYKNHYGEKVYGKKCLTCMKWEYNKENATKYLFEEEAENNIYNSYKDSWGVEVLK
jgi:hypothetical protein